MSDKFEQIRDEVIILLPRLRRFAYSLTSDRNIGDDLTQAAIERALSRAHQWDENKQIDLWIFKIAKNLWLDQLRAQKVRGPTVDIGSVADMLDDGSQAEVETKLFVDEVRNKMEDLPDQQRIVLSLVAIEGYSYKEVAEILEIPVGTVMSRLSRARVALVAALEGS